jgi:hypothetical protein
MNRNARRPLLLLVAGAVAPVFGLTACASASSTVPADAYVAIPAAAQTLTLSLNYGGNADGRKPPAPVTVTSPAKVSEVARLVAGQPPQQPAGAISCPASDGKSLKERPVIPNPAATPRRDFVVLAASVASVLGALRAAPAGVGSPRGIPVDEATVGALEQVMASYRAMYQSVGSRILLEPVCGALGLLAGIAPSAGRHRNAVVSLIGQAASLAAGMLLLDQGDYPAASRYEPAPEVAGCG